jgi:metal-responsive CopG/Arc/MetJ family transcriptional regulator
MRLHITLRDEIVRELDHQAGVRGRSAYIARAVERALDDDSRWELLESALGSISDAGHDWDEDAGRWVRDQRRADERRVG